MAPRTITFVEVTSSDALDLSERARDAIAGAAYMRVDPRVDAIWLAATTDATRIDDAGACGSGDIVWLCDGDARTHHARDVRAAIDRGEHVAWLPAIDAATREIERNFARWIDARPLFGRTVYVTRPPGSGDETAALLRDRWATAVLVPTLQIGPPDDPQPIDEALEALATYDAVAFTSATTVASVVERLTRRGRDARALAGPLVGAIGAGTASALQAFGVRADVVPAEHRGEALADALLAALAMRARSANVSGTRVLLPRAAVARDALPDALRAAGVHVDIVEAYRARPPSPSALTPLIEALRAVDASRMPRDVVLVTASSTVDNLVDGLRAAGISDPQDRLGALVVATIGALTSETCRKRGVRVDVEAAPSTLPALIAATESFFTTRDQRPASGKPNAPP